MAAWVAPAVLGAASVVSGILGNNSAKKAAAQQRQSIIDAMAPWETKNLMNRFYPGLYGGNFGAPGTFAPGVTSRSMGRTFVPGNTREAAAFQIWNLLANPGQQSPIQYERLGEQSRYFSQALQNQGRSAAGVSGWGQNSGLMQAMQIAALLAGAQRFNEGYRDLALQSEQLRRQDVLSGLQSYGNVIEGARNQQARTAGALAGAPVASNAGIWGNLSQVLGGLANAYASRTPTSTAPATTSSAGSFMVSPYQQSVTNWLYNTPR